MNASSTTVSLLGVQVEIDGEVSKLVIETWQPLKNEIQSLTDTLHDLDDDKTKSMDIIAEYTEKITNAIPSNPIDMWYPKPIHQLLSIHPLLRIDFPLEVLEVLLTFGFDVNEYYNSYDKLVTLKSE